MVSRLPVIDEDGEIGDLSEVDPSLFRPAREVLPPALYAGLVAMNREHKGRGKNKAPTKERVTIRLSPDVVGYFRATGTGWQGRVDAALKDWVTQHAA